MSSANSILARLGADRWRAAAAEIPTSIPLWPDGAPGSEGKTATEVVAKSDTGELRVSSIHQPSLTPYLPAKDKATGAAILVIPGGGHRMLAITHEGYNVGEWLAARGIAAFVLKHRLAREEGSTYKIEKESFADAQRAMRLDPQSGPGMATSIRRGSARSGFSAGGELVCADHDALRRRPRRRRRSDRAAAVAAGLPGPDLSGPLGRHPADQGLDPGVPRRRLQRSHDIAEGLAEVYLRFKRAGAPAELHMYSTGGHGFGLRATNTRPVGRWMVRFEEWLVESGFLKKAPSTP